MYCIMIFFIIYKVLISISIKDNIKSTTLTPSLRHYLSLKEQYPDFLLLYQIGDFFEMFFDDAERGSKLLDIALTKRDKSSNIHMAGIPVHSLDNYLEKLIRKGVMVAICEQIEQKNPSKKSSPFHREITRFVTPGTITEENLLDSRRNNYLASIYLDPKLSKFGISWLDLSTGEFGVSTEDIQHLSVELCRLSPSEILVPKSLYDRNDIKEVLKDYNITIQHEDKFNVQKGREYISRIFKDDKLGPFTSAELSSSGAILHYIEFTQKGKTPHLKTPISIDQRDIVQIDPATRKALEINITQTGKKDQSLVHILDRTLTSSGGRLLASRINSPLKSLSEINNRLDLVQFFVENPSIIDTLKPILRKIHDIERCFQRVSIDRCSPRDLYSIKLTLQMALQIRDEISNYINTYLPSNLVLPEKQFSKGHLPLLLLNCLATLSLDISELIDNIDKAVIDNCSISLTGFVKENYNKDLDELRNVREKHLDMINELQSEYRSITGASTLKIKYTKNLGYYIEIPHKEEHKITKNSKVQFIHCQTKVNSLCFKTHKIMDIESMVNRAMYECDEIEKNIFNELCALVLKYGSEIKQISYSLSTFDVAISSASIAIEMNMVRPILDESNKFVVKNGRHLSVECSISDSNFIPNDCILNDESNMWLICGANMGGKSTFLRQNALICILAQAGFYVPASEAHIGIVDSIFTRVGAFDDLSNNRSTFMVEMTETSNILNTATSKSLVILDEIGRGTSTLDGLSIAWSVLEYLHNNIKCRTLFATHFHELNSLASSLEKLTCYHIAVVEEGNSIMFTHKVIPGESQQSYGVHVAKLAGMPDEVIQRAFKILNGLKAEKNTFPILEQAIKNVNINTLTPIKAFELICKMQDEINNVK